MGVMLHTEAGSEAGPLPVSLLVDVGISLQTVFNLRTVINVGEGAGRRPMGGRKGEGCEG